MRLPASSDAFCSGPSAWSSFRWRSVGLPMIRPGSISGRGLIENVGGVDVLRSYWSIAFLPCSIITVLAAWWLTVWLYPPEKVALEGGYDHLRAEITKMGPLTALQKKAALLIALA